MSISLVFGSVLSILMPAMASAQIIPDESLQNEASRLVGDRPNRIDIDGGAQRGINLFHSFREFNIAVEDIVYFRNPIGVENIISRVTGGTPSRILGGLGVRGTANLFLLNPNGVLIGEQATVNVSGSFVATSADAIQFGSQGFFSADHLNPPDPLLTIQPSAFLFNQPHARPASITHSGRITVDENQSIVLLGRDTSESSGLLISGGILTAPEGQIALGAVQSSGTVNLIPRNTPQNGQLQLQFPDSIDRGNVTLEDSAVATVAGQGSGNIAITASQLVIRDSSLTASLNQSSDLSGQLGQIALDATGTISLSNSQIRNTVPLAASANSGDIQIQANAFSANQGTVLETSNLGAGQAGNIEITAQTDVVLDGNRTRIRAAANRGGITAAGDIAVTGRSIFVTDGARMISSAFGQGNAGNISIAAAQQVLLEGAGENLVGGGLYSTVERTATGNGGTISIRTGDLTVLNGAGITVRSLGQGNSGTISIVATSNVRFSGTSDDPNPLRSGAFSTVEATAIGSGGTIQIEAGSLRIEDGAQLRSSLEGSGSAGNVIIRIQGSVSIDGTSRNGSQSGSGIFASLSSSDAEGKAGTIRISADSLFLTNNAQILSSTSGVGNAGAIRIRAADNIRLERNSGIFANVLPTAIGNGGNIFLLADAISISGTSQVSTSTSGSGNAGNITVIATDAVILRDRTDRFRTSLLSDVRPEGSGQGGDIAITAPHLTLLNGAEIRASTAGRGNAGQIQLDIDERLVLESDSAITTAATQQSPNGQGGNINIQADTVRLSDRSVITAQSESQGDAGNITLTVRTGLTANHSNISTAAQTSGGAITITGGEIRLRGDSNIRTEVNSDAGNGGDITLSSRSIVVFDDSDILAFAGDRGGDIRFNTPAVFFESGYQPTETAFDREALNKLDQNDRVDINASGAVAGVITLPDVSFIENSLADLAETVVDPDRLIANSCIARTESGGTFLITGSGGLPPRPGVAPLSPYPTGEVRAEAAESSWQPGEAIVEPQGVYQLPGGQLVMSRECS